MHPVEETSRQDRPAPWEDAEPDLKEQLRCATKIGVEEQLAPWEGMEPHLTEPSCLEKIEEDVEASARTQEPDDSADTLEDAAEPQAFTAVLHRQAFDDPLGLSADFSDNKYAYVCCVTAEEGSAVGCYNDSGPQLPMIRPGDYFLAINGVSHNTVQASSRVSHVLRDQLQNELQAVVEVSRPFLFECEVEKNSIPLGLDLVYNEDNRGAGLVIRSITDGSAQNCVPEIKVGDRIVGVGDLDMEALPADLVLAIHHAKGSLHLKISRPMPSEGEAERGHV